MGLDLLYPYSYYSEYRVVTIGICTSVTEKACEQYAASKGTAWKGKHSDRYNYPKGCRINDPDGTNEVWFNTHHSASKDCANIYQCVCLPIGNPPGRNNSLSACLKMTFHLLGLGFYLNYGSKSEISSL